ncbi:hypothetical protein KY290_007699 [Solanum tuberosum]|uniref:Uncharacterized protein n=1 Tax=Solanum tuberosum TaxID=4113 RepID=A0ABQ7W6A9_SOLTU|nr:hypothetical protein KY290_007699 [Solanum tuberosum]
MRMQNNDVAEKWIKIKYDYVPKYCQTCMIQGHDEEQCYVVHPELHPYKEKSGHDGGKQIEERPSKGEDKGKELMGRGEDNLNMRKGEDFVEPKRKFWGGGRNKEPQKVWNKVGIITGNKFNMLGTGNLEQSLNEEEEQTNGKEIEMEHRQSKENSQDLQGSSHSKQMHTTRISNNIKDMTGEEKETSSEHTISEVRSRIEKQGDLQQKKLLAGVNEEELMSNRKGVGSRHTTRRESVATSRNLVATESGEEKENCYEEREIVKGTDLIDDENEGL